MRRRATLIDHAIRGSLLLSRIGRRKYRTGAEAFFDDYFTLRHLDWARHDFRSVVRQKQIAQIVEMLAPVGSIVVDVGCGVGDVLAGIGWNYTRVGLGYTDNDLVLAKTVTGGKVAFARGSASAIPLANRSVWLLICLGVLNYIEDHQTAFAELARVIEPGGWMILGVAAGHYFPEYKQLIGFHRTYDRESVVQMLSRSGFRLVRDIERYPALGAIHFVGYAGLIAIHKLLNACGYPSRSLYVRRGLGTAYAAFARLLHYFNREHLFRASTDDSRSTFVLAQRLE